MHNKLHHLNPDYSISANLKQKKLKPNRFPLSTWLGVKPLSLSAECTHITPVKARLGFMIAAGARNRTPFSLANKCSGMRRSFIQICVFDAGHVRRLFGSPGTNRRCCRSQLMRVLVAIIGVKLPCYSLLVFTYANGNICMLILNCVLFCRYCETPVPFCHTGNGQYHSTSEQLSHSPKKIIILRFTNPNDFIWQLLNSCQACTQQ